MKYATTWWGIQILAETESDKKLLEDLLKRLPKNAEHDYEYGEISITEKEDSGGGFSQDEIDNAELVVEFIR